MRSEVTCTLFIVHCTLYNVQPSFLYFHTSEVKVKMAAVAGKDSSLASKCLDLCQALATQGKEFTFSVTIGSSFSFSLDTRKKSCEAKQPGKRSSPSTMRRNARRKESFLKKKGQPPASSKAMSLRPNNSTTTTTTSNTATHTPLVESHCPTGRVEFHADYGDPPPSDAPPPPACVSCNGPTEWGLTRRLINQTKHIYHCLEFCMLEGSRLTTTLVT